MTEITIEAIHKYWTSHTIFYRSLQEQLQRSIEGRQCHHKVCVLHILRSLTEISNYLEIGVHNGTSMSYIVSHKNPLETCIGIDLFESTIERYHKDRLSQERSFQNIQKNNLSLSPITLLKGNSFDETTIDRVKGVLGCKQVDLLFIDGLHTSQGIRNDFERFSPFVKSGGWIIIDDYEPKYPEIITYMEQYKKDSRFKWIGVFQDNELLLQKL